MLAYLAFAAVAAAADIAGAVIVTTAHKRSQAPLRYFVAGGAGFMLAAAFVRMLPESAQVPHAFVFVLLGYFGMHLFEHTVAPHFHFGEDRGAPPAPLRPPRNLPPRQSDTFAGRERELRDLHACFAHEAVVGVTQQAAVHSQIGRAHV